jgi:mannose-6-phosphate isomerase
LLDEMLHTKNFAQPIELTPLFQERIWGRQNLAPFYANLAVKHPIGEVWFTFKENRTRAGERLADLIGEHPEILGSAFAPAYPGLCPLLVKFLFTSERLSVQVHPRDDYAYEHHRSLGKTEAWYVMAGEPDSQVAVGFKERLTAQRMEQAARSGEIETLLDWRPVKAGDVILVPAGTVHAIGAGVTICEVQQNSDITYRLYDYGRPRELHLEHGINVSDLGPHHYPVEPLTLSPGREELVACDYFRIERLKVAESIHFTGGAPCYSLLICVKGGGQIAGEPFTAGQSWLVPAKSEGFLLQGAESEWILTYTAASSGSGPL